MRHLPTLFSLLLVGSTLSPGLAQEDPADPPDPPSPPPPPGPQLVIDEPSFNWGEVIHGETIEHTFRVTNPGTEVLKIRRVVEG